MVRDTRGISWIKAARKDFESFPAAARDEMLDALDVVSAGGHPQIARPLIGLGAGITELALKHRGDAFRVVYALQIEADIWWSMPFRRNRSQGSRRRKLKST